MYVYCFSLAPSPTSGENIMVAGSGAGNKTSTVCNDLYICHMAK